MSSFFTLPASQRKRKRPETSDLATRKRPSTTRTPQKRAKPADDDSIASDSDSAVASKAGSASSSDSEDANETAAERRLKLAEQYLSNIRAEVGADQEEVGFDAADVDRELIAARLKEDVAEEKGKLHRYIAQKLDLSKAQNSFFRADTLAMTGIATCGNYVYTCSKDMRLIKWELIEPSYTKAGREAEAKRSLNGKPRPERRKPKQLIYTCGDRKKAKDMSYQHHTAPILCVAASADGKYLATGSADRRLIIWSTSTLMPLKIFSQHRDSVTSLAFRGKTNQLFSASKDRTVKIWSCDTLAYVETLFGHQDEVVDIAAVGGSQERCVSVGARDRSARLWKVVEESQLVFRGGGTGGSAAKRKDGGGRKGHRKRNDDADGDDGGAMQGLETNGKLDPPTFNEGSLDRVIQVDTQLFITGSDSGALSLFSLHKKKPLHIYPVAHGWDPAPTAAESSADVDVDIDVNANTINHEHNTDVPTTNGTTPSTHGSNGSGLNTHANVYNAQPTPRWITALASVPYSDLFLSGSWDGCVRVWRITSGGDKGGVDGEAEGSTTQRRIEAVGVLRDTSASHEDVEKGEPGEGKPLRSIVNDLSVFARGVRGDEGVCVVAALGTETRLGRWKKLAGSGRKGNGACVWEIPFQ